MFMRRTPWLALIAAAGVCLSMVPTRAQEPATAAPTVESLVAKANEASGGLDRIKAVRSFRQTGSLVAPDLAGSVPLVLYAKRPNLARQDVLLPGGSLIVGFDGARAWKNDPSAGPTALVAEQADAIEQQSEFDSPLVDAKAKGSTVEYVGAEMFAGKAVQHLKVTDKKGRVQHCYLDSATSLEVRIVSPLGSVDIEQQLSDYRIVRGIKFPFALRSLTGGRLAATITITKVELDVPLDDAFFKMPKTEDLGGLFSRFQ
jgi:outer membrane lipoprotein-sorting protein